MPVIVDRWQDVPRNAVLAVVRSDGRYDAYLPGDTLPRIELREFPLISRTQFFVALERLSLLAAFEAAVSASDRETVLWWNNESRFSREDARLIVLAVTARVTNEQLNSVWREAIGIR